MLFLGTEKYPKEEEYEDFLGRNGGASNAYTDMEDTNYYFNVSPLDHADDNDEEEGNEATTSNGTVESVEEENSGKVSSALSGALDRFAQFFISPLFDESMLENYRNELSEIDYYPAKGWVRVYLTDFPGYRIYEAKEVFPDAWRAYYGE